MLERMKDVADDAILVTDVQAGSECLLTQPACNSGGGSNDS